MKRSPQNRTLGEEGAVGYVELAAYLLREYPRIGAWRMRRHFSLFRLEKKEGVSAFFQREQEEARGEMQRMLLRVSTSPLFVKTRQQLATERDGLVAFLIGVLQ